MAALVTRGETELLFDDNVGLGKSGFDIALPDPGPVGNVGTGFGEHIGNMSVGLHPFMNDGCGRNP